MNHSTSRRNFLARSAALAAGSWIAFPSWAAAAEAFPAKPIRLVVGYPPGQTVDSAARAAAMALASTFGKPVYVDNKAGANGMIAAQEVKQAAADGYTLLFGTSGQLAINPAIYKKLPYDPLKDLAPISLSAVGRLYLVVPATSPFNSLADLVAYAKANPGKLSYGSGGRGITAHLAMEMLKKQAGIDILHVPYKGSTPALTDLIGGRIDVMMDAGGLMLPQITQGKVKALGVSSKTRFTGLPAVKTISEQGYPAFEVLSWTAAMAPAGTPPDIITKLNKAFVDAQHHPEVIKAALASSSDLTGGTPEEFGKFLVAETRKWHQAAKDAGVELE
jgi:tripartite-type tricarboxylate transporter receptor subunit TctC